MKTTVDERALLYTLAEEGLAEAEADTAMAETWQLIMDVLDDLDGALSRLVVIAGYS